MIIAKTISPEIVLLENSNEIELYFFVMPFENKIKKKMIKIEMAAMNEYKSTPGFYCLIRGKSLSKSELSYSWAVIYLVRNLSNEIGFNLKSLFCLVLLWS